MILQSAIVGPEHLHFRSGGADRAVRDRGAQRAGDANLDPATRHRRAISSSGRARGRSRGITPRGDNRASLTFCSDDLEPRCRRGGSKAADHSGNRQPNHIHAADVVCAASSLRAFWIQPLKPYVNRSGERRDRVCFAENLVYLVVFISALNKV